MTAVIKADNDDDRLVIEEWLPSHTDVVQVRLTRYAISVHLELVGKKTRSASGSRSSNLIADLDRTVAAARR
jgi:hypothetical protein